MNINCKKNKIKFLLFGLLGLGLCQTNNLDNWGNNNVGDGFSNNFNLGSHNPLPT
jgi:hypothetical protein